MKNKNNITFDELDIKCITELPIIVEVLSATGNKLKQIFEPIVSDLYEELQRLMPPNWKLIPKDYRNIFYPIAYYYDKNKITQLSSHFSLYSEFSCIHRTRGKQDIFSIVLGFYYDADEDGFQRPCYYFQIGRNVSKKQQPYHPYAFYKDIQNKLPDREIRIYHPEKGDDMEDITLVIFEHNVTTIEEGYREYKEEILEPFFATLPA